MLFAGIMILPGRSDQHDLGDRGVGDSRFFVQDATFVLSGLNTWGWVMLLLGVLQLFAAYAIWKGSEWARWFGIALAGLNRSAR